MPATPEADEMPPDAHVSPGDPSLAGGEPPYPTGDANAQEPPETNEELYDSGRLGKKPGQLFDAVQI